ncbi:MAG: hypothetical protein KKE51_10390 [Gammaproteobacteria bacterium]|nr:hypothetical protein [Gammaproteobacteria bacterium]MBU1602775.1 hypothetical protein [Gammaproteobacteria bacterium]MBU2432447.1 hypothetical protein [Gammaproteobacteria bacterium]MBU2449107.1 hypothetical protein [Gammaproteobacteria bacterium]
MNSLPGNASPSSSNLVKEPGCKGGTPDARIWQEDLPAEWLNAIDPPLYYAHYREYEISAERAVGYDADDKPCFTCHRFLLTQGSTGETAQPVVTFSERMAAWRLRDERWLVFRRNSANHGSEPASFYAFSSTMPR